MTALCPGEPNHPRETHPMARDDQRITPELRDERKRVADLIGSLLDQVLKEREDLPPGSRAQRLTGEFAGRLARLAKVQRDGGTVIDLDRLEEMVKAD